LISIVFVIVAIYLTLVEGYTSITLSLFWIPIAMCATVIIAKYASPRLGRHSFACVGLGLFIIQLIVFVHRYYNCDWNFFVCDRNNYQIRSSITEDTAQKMIAFDSIYRFFAQMLLYVSGMYTLEFKQHLAWNTMFSLIAHYNLFALIMTLYFESQLSGINVFGVLSITALLSATALLHRAGRNKAKALVLQDSSSRQQHWNTLIHNSPDFKQHITRLQSTITGGSLTAVCERLDPTTKNLVPRTVLQTHADINKLYRDCFVLNYFFQDWVRTWFPSCTRSDEFEVCNPKAPYRSVFNIRVDNCFPDIVRGPIKDPNRVISKVDFANIFLRVKAWCFV
jgi:hypothetical protein